MYLCKKGKNLTCMSMIVTLAALSQHSTYIDTTSRKPMLHEAIVNDSLKLHKI